MDEKLIVDTINANIAKTVFDSIDENVRNAILEKAIAKAIDNIHARIKIDDIVANKVGEVVTTLLKSDDWQRRIIESLESGFNDYVANLREAMPNVLAEIIHGKDGPFRVWSNKKPQR